MKTNPRFKFYDPHPGLAGALAPIPEPVRLVANALAGKTLTMLYAMKRFYAVAGKAGVEVRRSHLSIQVWSHPRGSEEFPQHVWCAIKFRPVK